MHQRSAAKICLQLGHSGPKGSTQLGWEKIDAPLRDGNWELIAPSPIPWSPYNQVPRAMTRDDMDAVRDAFVTATQYGARAGFDMLELHAAHGYLLSSFISPLTNRRDDDYGGSLRQPPALSAGGVPRHARGWPAHKPMSVRISATDWVEGGIVAADAVEIARAFKQAGVDLIDVSAGQTSIQAQPVYGRMFQTPFADRIRNEIGIATMAVGNITEPDHLNAIIAAGPRRSVRSGAAASVGSAVRPACGCGVGLHGAMVAAAVSCRARRRSSGWSGAPTPIIRR